ncbi:MAG: hypothetical protein ACJ72O_02440 [Marmoricola sp.]
MATQTRPETLVDDPGVWFGITTGLLVLTFFVAGLARMTALETAVAAVVVGGLAAARLRGLVALALGVIAWAFYTGFTENAFGQLTFREGDLVRLAGFALATAGFAAVARRG